MYYRHPYIGKKAIIFLLTWNVFKCKHILFIAPQESQMNNMERISAYMELIQIQ